MNYNDKWTREKFLEYRKLKKNGYTTEMLIDHFGEDIYHSGIYNKKSTIMPWLEFITEIKITPEYTNFNISKEYSDIYEDKLDYIINFNDNDIDYIISFFYYIIDNIETYNILLTTKNQWDEYKEKMGEIKHKGYVTEEEHNELVSIVEKETGFNQLYSIMKKVSYILFDMLENELGNVIISLGETRNIIKINLYRNIIKNSFPNIEEDQKMDNIGNKYYLYKIKEK